MKTISRIGSAVAILMLFYLAGCDGGDESGPGGTSTVQGNVLSFSVGSVSHVPPGKPGILAALVNLIVPDAEAAAGGIGVHMVGTGLSSTTDNDGFFIMSGAPAGRHQLQFMFGGQTSTLEVDVPDDGTLILDDIRCTGQQAATAGRMHIQMNTHAGPGGMAGPDNGMTNAGMQAGNGM